MSLRSLTRAFSSGELAPEVWGRVDLAKFQSGVAVCRNFIPLPHGPAVNRPGFAFVRETKNSAAAARLIPFSYNNTQTFAIEVGAGYFRFHTQGAALLAGSPPAWSGATAYNVGDLTSSGGTSYYCVQAHTNHAPPNATYWYALPATGEYEIPNPFAAADLMDIHYVQSADVLTLVHPNYPVQELRRYGATNWQLTQPVFQAPTNAPTGPVVVATGSGSITYAYVVTAINSAGLEETVASLPAMGSTTATISGATKASPGVITTSAAHNLTVGDPITVSGAVGMTQLNGNYYTVNTVPSSTTLTLAANGVPVDTSAFGAYTSGGTITLTGVKNNLATAGNKNTITWNAVTGATRYNVYAYSNGLYGYIGQAAGTSFIDNNIVPDISQTPPINDTGFNDATGNYPAAVSYYEQRRCFGGTANKPQNIWMTRSGTESNLSYTLPVRDDNRIAFRIAAREASAIRHIVPVTNLMLLTASCEWRVNSVTSDALTPTTISVRPQSYIGANNVTPVVVGNAILYAQARGGHLREMAYNWQAQGYLTNDISLLAPHLFDFLQILDMAYAKAPYPILWAVSSNGNLLGMTYVPEQQVASWHRHDTDGVFESICCISENNIDVLYAVIRRTINGQTKRYVECLHSRQFNTLADSFFVDCGATYSGAPATSISGLNWLEGKTVNILADGAVVPPQVVTGGAVALPQPASTVQVGLPITADLQTLPLAAAIDNAFGQGRQKNVNKVWLRCYRSSGVFAGPTFGNLIQYKQRTTEPYGSPPALVSDEIEITLPAAWQSGAQVCVRQTDPLPLELLSMTTEVALGG